MINSLNLNPLNTGSSERSKKRCSMESDDSSSKLKNYSQLKFHFFVNFRRIRFSIMSLVVPT